MNNNRHLSIFDPTDHKTDTIVIIGCGNIGSHTATGLCRMGFENIILCDFDTVDDVNICTQDFLTTDLGRKKTAAVKSKLLRINPKTKIQCITKKFTPKDLEKTATTETRLIISAVDSIKARKQIKTMLAKSQYASVPVIDGRIGKEQVEVLFAQSAKEWDVIIPDELLEQVACTEKYIAYTPTLCATLIVATVKKFYTNEPIAPNTLFEFVTWTFIKS